MNSNTIILAPITQTGKTLKEHINITSFLRIIFLYIPIFMAVTGLPKKENILAIFIGLLLLEVIAYYLFYTKLNKEFNSRYFLYLNHASISSPVLFIGSIFYLYYSSSPWFYYVLYVAIYLFVELKVYLIFRKMDWGKIIKLANRKKIFMPDEKKPNLFEYKLIAMDADEQGYKKTWLDKFMDYWVIFLLFAVAPLAYLTTFTTPYRDYSVATFVASIMCMVLCVLFNKHTLGFYINLKLISMKERGEF